jgi:hypothetical protein
MSVHIEYKNISLWCAVFFYKLPSFAGSFTMNCFRIDRFHGGTTAALADGDAVLCFRGLI